jgi:ABC-type transport system involved in cytochrome c biogenesis ATPase subunit
MNPPEALALISFDDLDRAIATKRDAAREDTTKAGWERLLALTRGLAGQPDQDDVVTGRTWRLQTVRVSGYQGVSGQLGVDFDPTPGITVIQGPNGSGKSSLADAVDTALRGSPRPPAATGSGGNLPLWERPHHHRDASEVNVEVELRDGGALLTLGCQLDSSGRVTSRTANLHSDGQDRAVDLSRGWTSALMGHQPVFGYAHIERRVQVAKDLQAFLEPLLAFGGCFAALSAALDDATAPSQAAAARWTRALAEARTAVAAVDRERVTADAPALPALDWPGPSDDISTWLSTVGLLATGDASPEVTADRLDRARAQAEAVRDAVQQLSDAEASLHARLAGPLHALQREARQRSEAGDVCPVCDTSDVPWLERLTTNLEGIAAVGERLSTARTAIAELVQATRSELPILVEGLSAVDLPDDLAAAGRRLAVARAAFLTAVDRDGAGPTGDVRARASELLAVLVDELTVRAIDEASRLTAHERQWRLARRAAIEPLLSCWRDDGSTAAEEPAWRAAAANLRTLQNDLRRERAEALRATTAEAVEQLLDDVGVVISGLSVTQWEAGVQIKDGAGKDLSLSMLSAGQRNALLLAPLLALRADGPFGFLVLDDPVHAFDAVRVDRLAAILGRLAEDRRVVVLTHDERLQEHLLVQATSTDLHTVIRDAQGAVHVERGTPPWELLLEDAEAALVLDTAHDGVGRTDVVRGLCRMAVDDACRAALHADATAGARDVTGELAALDEKGLTRSRLKHLADAFPGSDLAQRAQAALDALGERLDDWNRASHGNDPQSAADTQEVQLARSVCAALTGQP